MPIYEIARYQVKPESRTKCEQAIREFVAYVKENEPGTRMYTSLQENDDPNSFVHIFIFADEAADHAHSNSEAVKKFSSILYPETLEPVKFTRYRLVATNM